MAASLALQAALPGGSRAMMVDVESVEPTDDQLIIRTAVVVEEGTTEPLLTT